MKAFFSVFFVLLLIAGCDSPPQMDGPTIVNVTVQRVHVSDVPITVMGPANIHGRTEANISARVTAPLYKLFAHQGETVKQGQLLAVLASDDLQATSADANAAVTSAQAALQRLKESALPANLSQARGELQAKAAVVELAQRIYDKRTALFKQGAISERELQTSTVERLQAQVNFNNAKQHLDLLEHHTATIDLRVGEAAVAQANARKALAEAHLAFTKLKSPIAGTVIGQFLFVGDMASPSTPIFLIADTSSAVARAQVAADHSVDIKTGQTCSFIQQQLTAGSIGSRTGTITMVSQAVDPTRNSIEVWCEIPNNDHYLRPGLFGRVIVSVGALHAAVLIPASAIEFEDKGDIGKVYVVDARNIAHIRKIRAEIQPDGMVRVTSGLRPAEVIVVEGEYGLPDRTQISPVGGGS